MALTDNTIKNAQPRYKKYKLTDSNGLYLLILPNGSKYFKYDYRFAGVKKELSIGVYPKISLKEARAKLLEAKALLDKGINPNEAKKIEKIKVYNDSVNTLQNIAEQWFEDNKSKWQTADEKWAKLEKDVLPALGSRSISGSSAITAPELLIVIQRIQNRGAIETAHRTKNIVREIYAYAIAHGRTDRNIAADLDGALKAKPPVIHRAALTDPAEIGKFLRAIEVYEGTLVVKCALKISPYLMLRPMEVASAEWDHVDLEKGVYKRPGNQMKKGRDHIVPLASQVVKILKLLQPLGGKYVFPSVRSRSKHINASSVNAAIRDMGYTGEEMTAHGFRGMASTILYENGFEESEVEMQLAHVEDNKVKAAYNHAKYLKKRIEMMQWWANYLDELRGSKD